MAGTKKLPGTPRENLPGTVARDATTSAHGGAGDPSPSTNATVRVVTSPPPGGPRPVRPIPPPLSTPKNPRRTTVPLLNPSPALHVDPGVGLPHVVRMLAGDQEGSVALLDEAQEQGDPGLRLLLLHDVGPSVLELLPPAKEQASEELVLVGHP